MKSFILISTMLLHLCGLSQEAESKLQVETKITNLPIATIIPYAGLLNQENRTKLEQAGWLLCDGKPVKRDKFLKLFRVIGSIHGRGDGVTTFNLPDYRGRFLRGVSRNSGRDPNAEERKESNIGGFSGNQVGSVQDDELVKHHHEASRMIVRNGGCGFEGCNSHPEYENNKTSDVGGDETRPKNAYINYLIYSGN